MSRKNDPFKDIPNLGEPIPETPYRIGDPIGNKWLINGLIGKGGMGIVYLVYHRTLNSLSALKSIREDLLTSSDYHRTFRQEIELWIGLERHPYIVEATWLEEISGRFYVEMDYIAPLEGMMSSSLAAYIKSGAISEEQALYWAIQFCYGMEHAYKHSIKCHRDIKPQNILIDQAGNVRISDFGLAKALDKAEVFSFDERSDIRGSLMSCSGRGGCGTPPYMPPEQFSSGEGNVRNDIYSFGVVLYEMLTGRLPYVVKVPKELTPEAFRQYWNDWEQVHQEEPIPELGGEIGKVVRRCLVKRAEERYGNISELREALSGIYEAKTGKLLKPPIISLADVVELNRKGAQLKTLGRYEEAISCFDRALDLNPRDVIVLMNKGACFTELGNHKEAIACYNQALEIDQRNANVWYNDGNSFYDLGQYREAIVCYDRAVGIDPEHAGAWISKGASLEKLDCHQEAIACYDRALEIDPRNADAWYNKGISLYDLGYYEDAITCYNQALEINPRDANAWYNKGNCFYFLGHYREAITYYIRTLEIEPEHTKAWYNQGISSHRLGMLEEARNCFQKVVELDPQIADKLRKKGLL